MAAASAGEVGLLGYWEVLGFLGVVFEFVLVGGDAATGVFEVVCFSAVDVGEVHWEVFSVVARF